VTSQYSVTSSSIRCCGVSPISSSHVIGCAVAAQTDNDPETGTCRRLTLLPPPPNTVFDTGPQSATWTAPGSPTSWIVAGSSLCRLNSETDTGECYQPTDCGPLGDTGHQLRTARITRGRSITVTQRGSFLAINHPPAEFCESVSNVDYSAADNSRAGVTGKHGELKLLVNTSAACMSLFQTCKVYDRQPCCKNVIVT